MLYDVRAEGVICPVHKASTVGVVKVTGFTLGSMNVKGFCFLNSDTEAMEINQPYWNLCENLATLAIYSKKKQQVMWYISTGFTENMAGQIRVNLRIKTSQADIMFGRRTRGISK